MQSKAGRKLLRASGNTKTKEPSTGMGVTGSPVKYMSSYEETLGGLI